MDGEVEHVSEVTWNLRTDVVNTPVYHEHNGTLLTCRVSGEGGGRKEREGGREGESRGRSNPGHFITLS